MKYHKNAALKSNKTASDAGTSVRVLQQNYCDNVRYPCVILLKRQSGMTLQITADVFSSRVQQVH